ncbi:hypothetical protein NLG97_g1241 [Lecanicillium saksenae]|uniref:Uncharacterized protein n=1 Tax=Lecanicillium saksenae TaxID=468837 RepID=A0ACC1R680_9HYPO|nr:hypothetical protein NLG97_g1241 [Lecanicillium saksenae]
MDAAQGSRLLSEVGGDSLEEILGSLRSAYDHSTAPEGNAPINFRSKTTGIKELDEIVRRHFQSTKIGGLSITGRYLPLVYKIASTLVSSPNNKAVIIIDYEERFEALRLRCSTDNLDHIYVLRPAESARDQIRDIIANTEKYLVYDEEAKKSANRELWGTIVIGRPGGGDVSAGWKGWLRVDREEVPPFPPDITLDEALQQREERQRAVDAAGWQASSAWGDFIFHEI